MPLNNNHSFKSLLFQVTDDKPTVGTVSYFLIESALGRVVIKAATEYDAISFFRKENKGEPITRIAQLKHINP